MILNPYLIMSSSSSMSFPLPLFIQKPPVLMNTAPPLYPSTPTPWLQRWYPWGRDAEEPERRVAHAGVEARAQSAVLSASARSQPQPAHRLALPQRRLPAGQTPLQLSHNSPPSSSSFSLKFFLQDFYFLSSVFSPSLCHFVLMMEFLGFFYSLLWYLALLCFRLLSFLARSFYALIFLFSFLFWLIPLFFFPSFVLRFFFFF